MSRNLETFSSQCQRRHLTQAPMLHEEKSGNTWAWLAMELEEGVFERERETAPLPGNRRPPDAITCLRSPGSLARRDFQAWRRSSAAGVCGRARGCFVAPPVLQKIRGHQGVLALSGFLQR